METRSDLIQWWVSVRWNKVVWTESFHRQPESELHESLSRFIGDSADRRRWTRAIHRSSSAWRFPLLPALLFVHTFDKSKVLLLSHTCSKPQTCKSAHRHLLRLPSFLSRFPRLLNNPDHVLLFPERRLKVRLWFCFAPCRSGQWLSVARPQRQDVWERLQMDGRQADGKTILLDRSVDATWKLRFYSAEAAKVHTFSTPVEVQILKKKTLEKVEERIEPLYSS